MVAISDISEGIAEESDYALRYERVFEETNTYAGQIYDTDIVTNTLAIYPYNGGTVGSYGSVLMNAAGEQTMSVFFTGTKIDESRDITVYFGMYTTANAGDGHINASFSATGGSMACNLVGCGGFSTTKDLDCSTPSVRTYYKGTIPAANVNAEHIYMIVLTLNDAAPAQLVCMNITIEYYIKRSPL